MTVTVEWYDQDERIILTHYVGQWTWDEHYEALDTIKQVIRPAAPSRVDVIAVIEDNFLPFTSQLSTHSFNSVRDPAPNLGLIVIVAENRLITKMLKFALTATRRTRIYYRIARSLPDALAIISGARKDNSIQS